MKKKIGKLKLSDLSKAELEKSQMNALKGGGGYCICVLCICAGGISAMDYIDNGNTDRLADYAANGY